MPRRLSPSKQALSDAEQRRSGISMVALPLPDARLARVEPGPDVLLTPSAAALIEEWIEGWASSAKLIAASIPCPGPLLLHGPPGTGKTATTRMLARQLAGVRDVLVIDAMRVVDSYLGVTSSNISKAAAAAISAGAVLVLEEIDALASARNYSSSAEVENTRATTSIMRVLELPGPIVLTSNRLDVIDPAVIRRFEYVVEMPEPTAEQRCAIVARELGEDPIAFLGAADRLIEDGWLPPSLTLTEVIPLARRARRIAALTGRTAMAAFDLLLHPPGVRR